MILLSSSSSFILCSGTQLCLTLCDPMDLSSPGSSVHGILHKDYLQSVKSLFKSKLTKHILYLVDKTCSCTDFSF